MADVVFKCKICGKSDATVRLVVRDDYDALHATYALPTTDAQRDRMCALLDRIPGAYAVTECEHCRRAHAKMELAELEYIIEQRGYRIH